MVPSTGCLRFFFYIQKLKLSFLGVWQFAISVLFDQQQVGTFRCNPQEGWLQHAATGWKVFPEGLPWASAEWTIDNNYSETAAGLKNKTLGNSTNIWHLFKLAGKELPKPTKVPMATGPNKTASTALAVSDQTKFSLKSLALSDGLPALQDKEATPERTSNPEAEAIPASKAKPKLIQGPDGCWRLSLPAAGEAPATPPQTSSTDGRAEEHSSKVTAEDFVKAETPGTPDNSGQQPPSPGAATDVYSSEDEGTKKAEIALLTPVRKRKFMSPPQRKLRILRNHKSAPSIEELED